MLVTRTFIVDSEVWAKLKAKAQAEGKTISELIRDIIEASL